MMTLQVGADFTVLCKLGTLGHGTIIDNSSLSGMIMVAVAEVRQRLSGPSYLFILGLDIPLACDPAEYSGGPHHATLYPRIPSPPRSQPAAPRRSPPRRSRRRKFTGSGFSVLAFPALIALLLSMPSGRAARTRLCRRPEPQFIELLERARKSIKEGGG